MTLLAFLTDAGYVRIPLERNGVGHFHTSGTVDGAALAVLVDTGASSTLVDLAQAEALGLARTKVAVTGAGAGGGGLEIYQLDEAVLHLGGLPVRPIALMAMDLSHVNQALAMKGEPAVAAILGTDALDAHHAVLDYPSRSLFLKP